MRALFIVALIIVMLVLCQLAPVAGYALMAWTCLRLVRLYVGLRFARRASRVVRRRQLVLR